MSTVTDYLRWYHESDDADGDTMDTAELAVAYAKHCLSEELREVFAIHKAEIDVLKAQRDELLADLSAATEVGDQATPADIVGVVKAMWEELRRLLKQADALKAQNAELLAAHWEFADLVERVLPVVDYGGWCAISEELKAAIAKARGDL